MSDTNPVPPYTPNVEPDPEGGFRYFDVVKRRWIKLPEVPIACASCHGTGRIALLTSVVDCLDCPKPSTITGSEIERRYREGVLPMDPFDEMRSGAAYRAMLQALHGNIPVGDTIRVKKPEKYQP